MGNVLTLEDDEIEKRIREFYGNNCTPEQIAAAKTLLRDEGLRNILSDLSRKSELMQQEESLKAEETFNRRLEGDKLKDDEIKEDELKDDEVKESGILQKIVDKYSPEELHEHAVNIMNSFSPTTIVAAEHLFKSP